MELFSTIYLTLNLNLNQFTFSVISSLVMMSSKAAFGVLQLASWVEHQPARTEYLGMERMPNTALKFLFHFCIHLVYFELSIVLFRQLLKYGSYHLARTAPISVKIDDCRNGIVVLPIRFLSIVEELFFEALSCQFYGCHNSLFSIANVHTHEKANS